MSGYEIERGIEIPRKRESILANTLQCMEVGDSVFISDVLPNNVCNIYRKLQNAKFTVRTLTENGIKGIRVWRIE